MGTKTIQPKSGMVWEVCARCGRPQADETGLQIMEYVRTKEELKEELNEPPDYKCQCGGQVVLNHNLPGAEHTLLSTKCYKQFIPRHIKEQTRNKACKNKEK